MAQITLVDLLHAYSSQPLHSIWLVPGNTNDFELPENEEQYPHIDDYLKLRGICIHSKIPVDAVEGAAQIVIDKFKREGYEVIHEMLCDD